MSSDRKKVIHHGGFQKSFEVNKLPVPFSFLARLRRIDCSARAGTLVEESGLHRVAS